MPKKLVHVKPSKARVALALLLRPTFWPDLWRRVKLNIGQAIMPAPMGQGRHVGTAWAASISIDETQAIGALGLEDPGFFSDQYEDLIDYAARIEKDSPETLGGGGGVDLIWRICEGMQAKTVIETGVAYGWSSLAILCSVSRRDGKVYSVDMPHPLLKDKGLTGAVVPASLRNRWTLIREPDHTGLAKALSRVEVLDFIHYDSDKSYHGRAASYRRLWPRLRSGGILMSDDIADNTAFRDFAAEVGSEPVVVYATGSGLSGARYVGILVKA